MILTGKELIRKVKSVAARERHVRKPKPRCRPYIWVKFAAAAGRLRRHYEKKGVEFNHTYRSEGVSLRFVIEPAIIQVGSIVYEPSSRRGMIEVDDSRTKACKATASLAECVGFYVSYCKRRTP